MNLKMIHEFENGSRKKINNLKWFMNLKPFMNLEMVNKQMFMNLKTVYEKMFMNLKKMFVDLKYPEF